MNAALVELHGLTQRLRETEDLQLFQLSFERWKARVVKSLSEVVPPADLARFERLPVRPSWVQMDDAGDPAAEHQAYLIGLAEEMAAHPEEFGSKAVRVEEKGRAVERSYPKPESLQLPEKVTLAWMFKHVPVPIWLGFGTIVVGAFLLGARIALIPQIREVLQGWFGAP